MTNVLENYSPKNNFWEFNQQFTAINPFKSFYKADRSKNKKDSSDVMWAIALAHHPKSELYYVDSKESIIARDMFDVKKADVDDFWEKKRQLVDAFIDASLTQAEKSLISWEKRLKQRDAFLSEQTYTFGWSDADGIEYKDNTKSFDDMQSKTAKFYEEYFKIRKELQEEEDVVRGKKDRSATGSGDI